MRFAGARWEGADHLLLDALHACGHRRPALASAARALSYAGEHGALWLAAGLTGAVTDRPRRGPWLRATALTATAHLASVTLKRLVRRPRPSLSPIVTVGRGREGRGVLRPVVGRHSFPSSHATSAVAAALVFGALRPGVRRVGVPLATAMCLSRLVVGVHYPTDVAAGALLGAVAAKAGRTWVHRDVADRFRRRRRG
ncbi:phosphatase PAP2 family protein [Streptomyces ficellus]|uniref:Phosphatase PAP2 family protein n=1 Tax=Streptomyces ficellus TaxID=1977088 RepID=A0A6I6FIM3_9ACTN|nr:phosphatase PAP2 family protein [Streptomyces ficellus]QGV78945.1 phosphatase PAP2 family protein [Streptomyces ficellus]